jgi:hypothetical protein
MPPPGQAANGESRKKHGQAIPYRELQAGPWGIMEIERIIIEPPSPFVNVNPDLQPYRRWLFRNMTIDKVRESLQKTGMDDETVHALLASAMDVTEINGVVIQAPDNIVRGFPPSVRASLYTQLARDPANMPQSVPFRFRGTTICEWFANSSVRSEIMEKIRPLIYRRGKYQFFSDLHLVLPDIKSPAERVSLLRTLYRVTTLSVKVRTRDGYDPMSILTYWSTGNRVGDVEPVWESLINDAESVDVVYFLPVFGRTRLYNYVNPAKAKKDISYDCHWTTFNFFNDPPEDRFANTVAAQQVLNEEYIPIDKPTLPGDIVLLLYGSSVVHSCVHIAGDIVFTKNGSGYAVPFTLEKLENVIGFYQEQFGSIEAKYYRRRENG